MTGSVDSVVMSRGHYQDRPEVRQLQNRDWQVYWVTVPVRHASLKVGPLFFQVTRRHRVEFYVAVGKASALFTL